MEKSQLGLPLIYKIVGFLMPSSKERRSSYLQASMDGSGEHYVKVPFWAACDFSMIDFVRQCGFRVFLSDYEPEHSHMLRNNINAFIK